MRSQKGRFIGVTPAWTTTETSGIFSLGDVAELKASGQWPRGPVAPVALSASASASEVSLAWTTPATLHGSLTGYAVEYTPSGGSPVVVATGSTSASYTVTGLANGTEYTFRVAAINHTTGEWSGAVTATPVAPPTAPTAPTALSVAVSDEPEWSIAGFQQLQATQFQSGIVPYAMQFSEDGSSLITTGPLKSIRQYSLASPWSIGGSTLASTLTIGTAEQSFRGHALSHDGLQLYVAEYGTSLPTDRIHRYTLSAPWDLSTATYVEQLTLPARHITGAFPWGVGVSRNGTRLFVSTGTRMYVHYLDAPWAINIDNVLGYEYKDDMYGYAFAFDESGKSLFSLARAASQGLLVLQTRLETAFDLMGNSISGAMINIDADDNFGYGIAFKGDGSRFYVSHSSNGNIYEFGA